MARRTTNELIDDCIKHLNTLRDEVVKSKQQREDEEE